jgi:hypothetical protein
MDICSVMEEFEHIKQLLDQNEQLTIGQQEILRNKLIQYIHQLLVHDFNRLVQLLYRVDVSEQKLKELLHKNEATDSAVIISDLLIERQQQKIKTKSSFRKSGNIPDDEKW